MSRNEEKTFYVIAALAVAGFFLWLLLRSKTAKGSQVTSKILSFSVTQLGAPQSAITALSYEQLQNDVRFWIDPGSGSLIPNTPGLLDGSKPLVALTDPAQNQNWWENNQMAVQDMAPTAFPLY